MIGHILNARILDYKNDIELAMYLLHNWYKEFSILSKNWIWHRPWDDQNQDKNMHELNGGIDCLMEVCNSTQEHFSGRCISLTRMLLLACNYGSVAGDIMRVRRHQKRYQIFIRNSKILDTVLNSCISVM